MRQLDSITDNAINGHEFEQTLGDSEEQGSLACCSPWGHKESETTDKLNNNNMLKYRFKWVWHIHGFLHQKYFFKIPTHR